MTLSRSSLAPCGSLICSSVAALTNADSLVREEARQQLVAEGCPAVPGLLQALSHPAPQVRWEAAKALSEIAEPASAPALVTALEDKDQGVRWLAAEALVRIGRGGLRCLLEALRGGRQSSCLRAGAYHVVHDLLVQRRLAFLRPVDQALENDTPDMAASIDAALAGLFAEHN
jgi:HEAT repeat protein